MSGGPRSAQSECARPSRLLCLRAMAISGTTRQDRWLAQSMVFSADKTTRLGQSTGATVFVPWYLTYLATAYGSLSQCGNAQRMISEAIEAVDSTNERWCEAEVLRTAGEVASLGPEQNSADAQKHFERALAIARQQQAKSWELRAAMSMARLWRDQDKVQARELLAPVYGWFTEGFDTRDLKEAKALLDALVPEVEKAAREPG
jgi:predicted ATPase